MNSIRLFIVFLVASISFFCSTDIAGPEGEGNGSETVARGIITDSTGAPAAGVRMYLLPAMYDPVADDTSSITQSATTDSGGAYRFEGVDSGTYNLEAHFPTRSLKALVKGIISNGQKNSVTIATAELRKTGSVIVNISTLSARNGDYLYLPGTNTFALVSDLDSAGQITLNDVPAGTFSDLMYVASDDELHVNLLSDSLTVHSGDTVVSEYAAWPYSATIILNTSASGSDVHEEVYDFPVLIRLTDAQFDFSETYTDGEDIRFTTSGGFPLDFEVERWDPENGVAEVWVRVDTIHGSDSLQHITMYWGNASADAPVRSKAVFDTLYDFIGVWHMSEDPSSGKASITDHSSNTYNATSYGAMNTSNSIDGMIGKALRLDGTDDYCDAGIVPIPKTYTVGLWVYLETLEHSQRFIFRDSSYTLWYDTVNTSIRMEHMDSANNWRGLLQDTATAVTMKAGKWYYLTSTFNGSSISLYVNGENASASKEIASAHISNSIPLLFGRSWIAQFVDGMMDEIRIEGTSRTPAWIRLCYMNQRKDDRLVVFR